MKEEFERMLKDKIILSFFIVSLVFGIVWIFLVPPLQSADEDTHFYSTVAIAHGEFIPKKVNNLFVSEIPKGVGNLENAYFPMAGNVDVTTKDVFITSQVLRDTQRERINFRTITLIPIDYIPQSLGVFVASIFTQSAWIWSVFGRLFDLGIFIIVGIISLRRTPILKRTLFMILLMPMTLAQAASCSYDITVISCSVLAFSYLASYVQGRKIEKKEFVLFSILGIFLLNLKIVYFPFLLIPLFLSKKTIGGIKNRVIYFIILVFPAYIVQKLWAKIIESVPNQVLNSGKVTNYIINVVTVPSSTYTQRQRLIYLILHPEAFISIVFYTITHEFSYYIVGFVGNLGFMDTPLCITEVKMFLIILIIIAICEQNVLGKKVWFLFGGAFVSIILLFLGFASLYVANPTIKGSFFEGIQGRYFIPIAPFLLAPLSLIKYKLPISSKKLDYFCMIISVLMLMYATAVIIERFYL